MSGWFRRLMEAYAYKVLGTEPVYVAVLLLGHQGEELRSRVLLLLWPDPESGFRVRGETWFEIYEPIHVKGFRVQLGSTWSFFAAPDQPHMEPGDRFRLGLSLSSTRVVSVQADHTTH